MLCSASIWKRFPHVFSFLSLDCDMKLYDTHPIIFPCSVMGREITGVRVEKKSNGVVVASNGVSHDKVHVVPKIPEESFEKKDYEVKECTEENSVVEKLHEKPEVLGVKTTNLNEGLIEGENENPGTQKSSGNKKSISPSSKSPGVGNGRANYTVPQPFALATEKRGLCTHPVGAETATSASSNNMQSPSATKNSQVVNPLLAFFLFSFSFIIFFFVFIFLSSVSLEVSDSRSLLKLKSLASAYLFWIVSGENLPFIIVCNVVIYICQYICVCV